LGNELGDFGTARKKLKVWAGETVILSALVISGHRRTDQRGPRYHRMRPSARLLGHIRLEQREPSGLLPRVDEAVALHQRLMQPRKAVKWDAWIPMMLEMVTNIARQDKDGLAGRFPFGTRLRVSNPKTGRA
jgi:hypothetical protein